MSYPPQNAPPLEGNYSSWAVYDTFADTDAYNAGYRQDAIINKLETKILLLDAYSLIEKTYTIATKALSAALITDMSYVDGASGFISEKKVSVQQTYFVIMGYTVGILNGDKIYIFKNGALLQTLHDIADLGIGASSIRNVAISPSGRYIVVSGYITALTSMGWVVLVGT